MIAAAATLTRTATYAEVLPDGSTRPPYHTHTAPVSDEYAPVLASRLVANGYERRGNTFTRDMPKTVRGVRWIERETVVIAAAA